MIYKNINRIFLSTLVFCLTINNYAKNSAKIVALLQVRNEEAMIEQCLRAVSMYADSIVILDDYSDDDTIEILEKLRLMLPIERIIQNRSCKFKVKDGERQNRQKLLDVGREVGGTHFILIDADEIFCANCQRDNWLRESILKLKSGQVIRFPMINVWNSVTMYRDDAVCSPRAKRWRTIPMVLCDDGVCNYGHDNSLSPAGSIHCVRVPKNRAHGEYDAFVDITDINYGVVHFKWANLKNIAIKKAWYMCLEYITANGGSADPEIFKKNADKINQYYTNKEFRGHEYNSRAQLVPVPSEWLNYSFFDPESFTKIHEARKQELKKWFKIYGNNYFNYLDILNPYTRKILREISR